ncbi:hypothetical protein D3875_04140 [Deinococcus cavernae]|uniref:Uncharacterized protein n=1 Tax=Deinococcus cavernae TaxID=2320857 RepID=A0A418VEE4_9DEIO|nr:hypothetical protein [Deinococcus cavernae]RJF74477.1 hypothetical protein D3875_04140 [Deinococcus cavernae]
MFEAFVSWWLGTLYDKNVLIVVRVVVGVLGLLSASAAFRNAWHPLETERTWTTKDTCRFRWINWAKALSLTLAAAYFWVAAFIEGDRVGSPNRLLIGNTTFALVFLFSWMDTLFWRSHYRNKRKALEIEAKTCRG